jgi:hypothetical protein
MALEPKAPPQETSHLDPNPLQKPFSISDHKPNSMARPFPSVTDKAPEPTIPRTLSQTILLNYVRSNDRHQKVEHITPSATKKSNTAAVEHETVPAVAEAGLRLHSNRRVHDRLKRRGKFRDTASMTVGCSARMASGKSFTVPDVFRERTSSTRPLERKRAPMTETIDPCRDSEDPR